LRPKRSCHRTPRSRACFGTALNARSKAVLGGDPPASAHDHAEQERAAAAAKTKQGCSPRSRRTSDSSPAALPRGGRRRSPRGHPTSCGYQRREVDGRAPAVFLMYQAIDRNSPFLDRRSQNPGSPGVLSLEP
jgi:hypothetical protein